ncbi:SEC-C metal-binding domain-containing protein [Xenorhabdus bovienii]|uniref:SEC-C metal-binding domain-containing protein n=1 Tax=Xenorhabdus bovienii TaxID=40576 RepID=UPI00237C55D9|nr:SEC-C metal-binding domain-containing protein [Xenorhabdus bovienii]
MDPHPNKDVDLAIIPISNELNNFRRNGKEYFFAMLGIRFLASESLLDELTSMEEIIMIGYPNGLWDSVNNLPITRKGITATHPKLKLNGKHHFLIDAACFPGSSGSPVYLANRGVYLNKEGEVKIGSRTVLLGTLWGGPMASAEGEITVVEIPTDTKPISISSIPSHLGYVIHASELLEFEKIIEKQFGQVEIPTISQQPAKTTPNRNELCPCGSGEKYKNCCGKLH